jgi:hypothetical protein
VTDLAAFLTARLDEDEAAARESYYEGQRWITEEEGVYRWPDDELVQMADRKADARHIARHDPARVLREVEAGRKLVTVTEGSRFLLKILAAIYSDHPDYRPEWAP